MKKIVILISLLLMPLAIFAQGAMKPVVIDGDEINYLQQEGKIVAKGNVVMKYKDVELYCDHAEFDAVTNIANIKGDAKIIRGDTILEGRDVVYNFNTYNAVTDTVSIIDPPIYGKAKDAQMQGRDKYVLSKGYITTCDLEVPHYRLTAKRVVVYPGQRVVAKNMVLMVGKVPVFYFPYFSQSLKDRSSPAEVVPGKNSEWGYYILTRWRYNMNNENSGRIHFDWYEMRGLGTGFTHKVESKKYGEALIKYYSIDDTLYSVDEEDGRENLFDKYPERRGIASKYLENDRYKAEFSYSHNPMPDLSIRSEFHKFSDKYFMKDFFEREYDEEPAPLSYVLATYAFNNSSISLLAQKRVNRFFSESEYLPQIEYDFYNQRLGDSKFYFESNDTFGNLNDTTADSGIKNTALRFYSDNTLSYISKIKWLHIQPYAGAYSAFYSRNRFGDEDTLRVSPKMGMTLSTKLFKIVNTDFDVFGRPVKNIRHVVTPELKYEYIHDPTVSNNNIYQFDTHDDITREEKITFTLGNKWQARNLKETWDFIYFSPSVEYQINPEGRESRFDKVKADLEIYPKRGISLTADTEYDVNTRRVQEVNADITFKGYEMVFDGEKDVEEEKYAVSYGHRYQHLDDAQGTLDFKCKLTPKLQFHSYIRYEYNREDFESQQYSIRRDLHCWWLDLGVNFDRREQGSKDLTFWFTFTLKAFPDLSISIDQGYDGAKASY